jgi:L-threonylcarbamoyladenylate synthase
MRPGEQVAAVRHGPAGGQTAAERFERAIRAGEVVLFPSDTVYGLACDPENAAAVRRLYEIKRRPPDKAAAVMFFELEAALATLPELGERTRAALARLLPGAVTALVPNPARRFRLACSADPETLGVRVVSVPLLRGVSVAVLQSSANLSGGPDARRLDDVAREIRAAVALKLDGGELPGVPSTVVDLREYERGSAPGWRVVRAGAMSERQLAAALDCVGADASAPGVDAVGGG